MSKSKNTIDPETMIKQYGADAVRWFILSDSPPEKDIQWSDTGVYAASKFLQKIWNLTNTVINSKKIKNDISRAKDFENKINFYGFKIDKAINNFQLNVAVAQFYEVYRYFNESTSQSITQKTLSNGLIKILKLMLPFTPHLANECLQNLNCKDVDKWPEINSKVLENLEINFAVQVNGKTRDIILIKKDLSEKDVDKIARKSPKTSKYIIDKKIVKTIFIKNKIINYII